MSDFGKTIHRVNYMKSITIQLPLPSSSLNAHGKTHWRKQQGPRKKAREDACILAKHAAKGIKFERATVSYSFKFPCNRGRDLANYIQMCKPYIDGIVDAGVIPDDKWQTLGIGAVVAEVDKNNPGVILHLMDRND